MTNRTESATIRGTQAYPVEGGLAKLADIMVQLRAPETGCPWDMVQTFATIAPYTIEEAYEVADAIKRTDWSGLCDELGDLLFQVVYHARMAEEAGHFGLSDVLRTICDKMVRRHPHVFGDAQARTADEQTRAWEAGKAAERAGGRQPESGALAGVALALPAARRAQKLQQRAARVGFDWPDVSGARDKLLEELEELTQAQGENDARIAEEAGDLLFAAVNVVRLMGVDAETALTQASAKFERRFAGMEQLASQAGQDFAELTLSEQDALWNRIKKIP